MDGNLSFTVAAKALRTLKARDPQSTGVIQPIIAPPGS